MIADSDTQSIQFAKKIEREEIKGSFPGVVCAVRNGKVPKSTFTQLPTTVTMMRAMICITRWVVLDPSHLLTFDIVNKQLIIRSITDILLSCHGSLLNSRSRKIWFDGSRSRKLKDCIAILFYSSNWESYIID